MSVFVRPRQSGVREVRDYISKIVVENGLQPGDKLPSYRELTSCLDVAYVTVKRAVDSLADEGLVDRQHGKGYFLRKSIPREKRPLKNVGLIHGVSRGFLFSADYLSEIVRGIMIASYRISADVHLFSMHQDGLVTAPQIEESGVDGVLLIATENDSYLETFAQWGTPGVVLDYSSGSVDMDFLACDNQGSTELILQHLADLGHRHIAYIDRPDTEETRLQDNSQSVLVRTSSDVRERRAAVVAAAKMVEVTLVSSASETPEPEGQLRQFISEWLSASTRPTAVIAYDDSTARLAIERLEAAGVRVPQDMSVCALASSGEVQTGGKKVTSCAFDFRQMGEQAVRLLKSRCEDTDITPNRIHRLSPTLLTGSTTTSVEAGE